MKKHSVLSLTLIIAVIAFGFMACGSGPAKDLTKVLNRPELPFSISSQKQLSTPEGSGHLVSFETAVFQINPEFMKTVNPQVAKKIPAESLKDFKVTAKRVEFYYEKEKALEIRKIEGLQFNMDEALLKKLEAKEPKGSFNMTLNVDEVLAEGYNLTPFLNKELKTTKEIFAAMLQNSQQQAFKTKGITLELKGKKTAPEGEENFSGKLTLADIQIKQNVNGLVMQKMYGKVEDINAEVFLNALKENQTLFDVNFALSGLKIDGTFQGKEGDKTFDFTTDKCDLNYKVAPNPEKTAFVISTSSQVDGVSVNVPGKPEIGKAFNIEKLASEFSFSPISPALAMTYMHFLHSAMNADQSEEGKTKLEAEMKQQGMAAMGELMQSQPTIHLKISPLKHPWTTIEGQVDMSSMGMTPIGKVTLSVTNASTLVETLGKELNLDVSKLKDLADFVSKYLIISEDGTGRMTLEMSQDNPGKPIINGKI